MPNTVDFVLNNIYIIISSITLIVAFISPALTAIINNRYQLKLKRLELEDAARKDDENHKREISQLMQVTMPLPSSTFLKICIKGCRSYMTISLEVMMLLQLIRLPLWLPRYKPE